jgi:ABC-type polysaccharide transport system permease subunit
MDFLNPYATVDVSLIDLIRNMGLALIMAVIWTFVVSKSTRLIVDTRQYLPVFLLIIPSMVLIISIIKSSIALSLGLVGALSIVRFRTPIKEPEELLYLFVAIAVGLGLGANQIVATLVGFTSICLGFLPLAVFNKSSKNSRNTFIDLIFLNQKSRVSVADVKYKLLSIGYEFQIKRVSDAGESTEILIDIASFDMAELSDIKNALETLQPDVKIIATQNARIIT